MSAASLAADYFVFHYNSCDNSFRDKSAGLKYMNENNIDTNTCLPKCYYKVLYSYLPMHLPIWRCWEDDIWLLTFNIKTWMREDVCLLYHTIIPRFRGTTFLEALLRCQKGGPSSVPTRTPLIKHPPKTTQAAEDKVAIKEGQTWMVRVHPEVNKVTTREQQR